MIVDDVFFDAPDLTLLCVIPSFSFALGYVYGFLWLKIEYERKHDTQWLSYWK